MAQHSRYADYYSFVLWAQMNLLCALQVIPIYGRGSEFDPRQEAIKVQPVPPRPAGQRPSAVQVGVQLSRWHTEGRSPGAAPGRRSAHVVCDVVWLVAYGWQNGCSTPQCVCVCV